MRVKARARVRARVSYQEAAAPILGRIGVDMAEVLARTCLSLNGWQFERGVEAL